MDLPRSMFPLATLASLALTVPLASQDLPRLDWCDDLEAARAEALRDDKPLLAVFRCEP